MIKPIPPAAVMPRTKRVFRCCFCQQIVLLAFSTALAISMWLIIRHAQFQTFRTSYGWANSYKQLAIVVNSVPRAQKIATTRTHRDQRTKLVNALRNDYESFCQNFKESHQSEKSRFPLVITDEATQHISHWMKTVKVFLEACDNANAGNIKKATAEMKNAQEHCEKALLAICDQYTKVMKSTAVMRYDITGLILMVLLALLAIGQMLLLRSEYLKQAASIRLAEQLGVIMNDVTVPQQVALSAASMALHPETNPTAVKELIQAVLHSLSAVQRLLDTAISRISSGPKPEPVRLPVLLHGICNAYQAATKEKGLEWRFYLAPSAETSVLVDHRAVAQILSSLLSNAVRYTEKGFVSLSVQLEDPAVPSRFSMFSCKSSRMHTLAITVTDTGCGIPKDSMAQIFQKFQQVRSGAGFGIGLFTVSRLINDLRGRVDVWSEMGKGTRFVVTIPVTKIAEFRFQKI